MKIIATDVTDYLAKVPEDRQPYFSQLRQTICDNIPNGFVEQLNYSMIGYVVPHSIFPNGYHCQPSDPLPFANIGIQKNFIGLYHMGLYANPELLTWFVDEYPKHCKLKLDMGKSCIRFKKPAQIPFELIGLLFTKMTINDWINLYQKSVQR